MRTVTGMRWSPMNGDFSSLNTHHRGKSTHELLRAHRCAIRYDQPPWQVKRAAPRCSRCSSCSPSGSPSRAASLGVSPPAFDDHPGQLYRLWHVVTHGPAPWAWNDGWWTGYPELQFYPPAFAYAGALLHAGTLGALSVPGGVSRAAVARLSGARA